MHAQSYDALHKKGADVKKAKQVTILFPIVWILISIASSNAASSDSLANNILWLITVFCFGYGLWQFVPIFLIPNTTSQSSRIMIQFSKAAQHWVIYLIWIVQAFMSSIMKEERWWAYLFFGVIHISAFGIFRIIVFLAKKREGWKPN